MAKRTKVLVDAMRAELTRSMKGLGAEGHPRPYYMSYLVRDIKKCRILACFGALWQEKRACSRRCLADIRVGSESYDQVTSGGLHDNSTDDESYDMIDLPVEDDADAIKFALWKLTDAKYREAVAAFYNRKSRDLSFVDANKSIASFTRLPRQHSRSGGEHPVVDEALVTRDVRALSRIFKKYPEIKNSYVEFCCRECKKYFVNSEGTVRTWTEKRFELVAHFWFLGPDNDDQSITVASMSRSMAGLPDRASFARDIRRAIQAAYRTSQGEALSSYAGPVLLAPRAAGLFLHEALGHRLEGSRFLSDEEGRHFQDQLGLAVMESNISIFDDPTLKSWGDVELVGHYPFDDEGTPARRVELVRDGRLVGFLSTRSPFPHREGGSRGSKRSRQLVHQPNGHARCQGHERPISRMANFICLSRSKRTWAELKSRLIGEVSRRGLPFGIILHDVEGGETGTDAYDFQAFLGQITRASKVYPDGREVPIRGVDFVGTPLASLGQILDSGGEVHVDNGYCGAESGMVPVSTVSPALLLGNLELQSKDPTRVTQYILPMPWLAKS